MLEVEADTTCALCRNPTELRGSHIISAFVFRWLRETSGAKGFLRSSLEPNLRVQDGPTFPMLGDCCEGRLAVWEDEFNTKVFTPLLQRPSLAVSYADWMLKFCVSISWRVLRLERDRSGLGHLDAEQLLLADRALERWSGFLLGSHPHPAEFEQHFVHFGRLVGHTAPGTPANMNASLQGDVRWDVACLDRGVVTFAKMGPFAVFGFVAPPAIQWEGTKVHVRHGVLKPQRIVLSDGVRQLLSQHAREHERVFDELSERQLAKIDEFGRRNIEELKGARIFNAMEDDYRLFGEDAFKFNKR